METGCENIVDPNIRKIGEKSFQKFSQTPVDGEMDQNQNYLYLPTEDEDNNFKIKKSSDLVINDWPELTKVVKNIAFVMKNDDFKKMFPLLPQNLQPKKLTNLFEKKVCISESEECQNGSCFAALEKSIQSESFSEALIRLTMHYRDEGYTDTLPEVTTDEFIILHDCLKSLSIRCYKALKTKLIDKMTQIEIDLNLPSQRSLLISANLDLPVIGTDHENTNDKNCHSSVLKVLYELLSQLFQVDNRWKVLDNDILELLRVPLSKMKETLDERNIAQIEDLAAKKFELIGSQVPSDLVPILLVDPFLPVTVGMIVAYEDEQSDAFLYAEIQEIHGDTGPGTYVTLDIKESTKKVQLLDVFFFPKTKVLQNFCTDIEVFLGIPDPTNVNNDSNTVPQNDANEKVFEDNTSFAKSLQEILHEVTEQIEEQYKILKEDEKAWKKFVRRLYLKWHPDKNPDNQEKATEVTKHIQNEVNRVEQGLPRENDNGNSSYGKRRRYSSDSFQRNGSAWEDIFRNFDKEARHQSRQQQDYCRNYNNFYRSSSSRTYSGYSDYGVPPSFQKNDIIAAGIWLHQAGRDVEAAKSNIEDHGYVSAYMSRMVKYWFSIFFL